MSSYNALHTFIYLSIYLSICLSVCLSIYRRQGREKRPEGAEEEVARGEELDGGDGVQGVARDVVRVRQEHHRRVVGRCPHLPHQSGASRASVKSIRGIVAELSVAVRPCLASHLTSLFSHTSTAATRLASSSPSTMVMSPSIYLYTHLHIRETPLLPLRRRPW